MCNRESISGLPLTFDEFAAFLREPPHEPCASEFQYYTPVEYEQAFTEAVRLYYHSVRRHIAHITLDHDLATDLAQTLFLNLYKARTSFDASYIYRAAKNTAFSAMRQTRRRRALETRWAGLEMRYVRRGAKEYEAADRRPLQDAALFERARAEAARNAVDRLPEKFRGPLVLLAAGGSYGEIAEVTGLNEGTVASRICRAKSILRRKLRRYL